MKTIILRIIGTLILLYFVWTNSHWSVALSLTLIFLSNEFVTYYLKELKK